MGFDMINVAIVEDDQEQALALESMLSAHPESASFQITRFASAAAFRLRSKGEVPCEPIGILFMDICLDDGDGVELVKAFTTANRATQVIYVTGYAEHCTRVYQSNHVYFLLKPFDRADLFDAVDKALANLAVEATKPIAVSVGGNVIRVVPDKIDFVESDRRKIRIHSAGETVETYGSLARMASLLPASFIQCHKSFLVNMDSVSELRADEIVLASGDRVPVSQKRRKYVKEALLSHLRVGL